MIIHCGLLIFSLSFASTSEHFLRNGWFTSGDTELDSIYSLWPSAHNAARLMTLRKRETLGQVGETEGGGTDIKIPNLVPEPTPISANIDSKQTSNHTNNKNTVNKNIHQEISKVDGNVTKNEVHVSASPSPTAPPLSINKVETKNNETTVKATSSQLDINNPGVLKRGLIVFGGFALMAGAYFIFYRRNSKKNDANNSHGANETNQFRYGVLQSDDRRDNMELSRIPLTMESDDDDDEDLEIFDLGQKKKSLSYVNLQTHEDDAANNSIDLEKDGDNLLLDIEDASSDTLINWSNNGNKSML